MNWRKQLIQNIADTINCEYNDERQRGMNYHLAEQAVVMVEEFYRQRMVQ